MNKILILLFSLLLVTGCTIEEENKVEFQIGNIITSKVFVADTTSNLDCKTLFAGQDIVAGEVCTKITEDQFCVNYNTFDNWHIDESHLWIGDNLTDMPQTRKGNPKIGNFPYSNTDDHSYCVPLSQWGEEPEICGKDIYIAAHAALSLIDESGNVIQTETGWSDGSRFVSRGSWATYSSVTLVCGDDPGPDPVNYSCETAFAKSVNHSTCFIGGDFNDDSVDDGFNRWGWTNGPLPDGDYEFPVYAAAGQCDINKGTHVGNLSITLSNGLLTYDLKTFSEFLITEFHLYAGTDPLPTSNGEFTVAPGQYPVVEEFSSGLTIYSGSFVVDSNSFVVNHAVVCGEY